MVELLFQILRFGGGGGLALLLLHLLDVELELLALKHVAARFHQCEVKSVV